MNARRRISRLLCLDDDPAIAAVIATQAAAAHANLVRNALLRLVDRCRNTEFNFIVAGEGAWLARQIIQSIWSDAVIADADERIGKSKSKSIGAVAVAELLTANLLEPFR